MRKQKMDKAALELRTAQANLRLLKDAMRPVLKEWRRLDRAIEKNRRQDGTEREFDALVRQSGRIERLFDAIEDYGAKFGSMGSTMGNV